MRKWLRITTAIVAIWVAPVFKNKAVQGGKGYRSAGYHGYWITDFTRPDRHFGSPEEFKTFVDAAHARLSCFFLVQIFRGSRPQGGGGRAPFFRSASETRRTGRRPTTPPCTPIAIPKPRNPARSGPAPDTPARDTADERAGPAAPPRPQALIPAR